MGKLPKRTYQRLYLAEWMEVTGLDQAAAAKAGGVNQSYISNMIAGRKKNPSAYVLVRITNHMQISVNDLYHPPPPEAALRAISHLSPGARAHLFKPKT